MKKGLKIFISVAVFVIVLALVIACGIGSQNSSGKWFTNGNVLTWFDNWGKGAEKPNDDTSNDNIAIASYALTADDFAAYGVSENAISAGVLTAEYTPSNTTNKRTGFTWRFAGNEWSNGKNIADYVKFTAGAHYAPECTYEVLQPFGDTIIVEATSRANSALKATTQIDYMARYDDPWGDSDICLYNLDYLPIFDELCNSAGEPYSITPDSFSATVKITVDQNYIDWLNSKGYEQCNDKVVTYENVTENIPFSKIFYDTDLNPEWMAELCSENGTADAYFRVTATITCYYEGEELYSFTDIEGVWVAPELLEQMGIPGESLDMPDKVII